MGKKTAIVAALVAPAFIDLQFITDLKSIAKKLKDSWSLCEFAGKSEAEFMVWGTISAAIVNLRDRGVPCSFKAGSCDSISGGGLANNPAGYRILLDRGWIEEQVFDSAAVNPPEDSNIRGKTTVIWPTRRLLDDLKSHLSKKK